LPVLGHDHDVVEDLLVDPARRVDIGHGDQGRALGEAIGRRAVLDRRHRDRVLRLRQADAACRPDDVRALDMGAVHVQMAHRHRQVHRLGD